MTPDQFKEARQSLGLTQDELGRWLGRSGRNIGQWERGERRIDPTAVIAVRAFQTGYRPDEASA